MDPKVKEAQQWLNKTYGGNSHYTLIEENGRTGNIVMEALVTALQIDLGLSNVTGYFGDQTAAAYEKVKIRKGDTDKNNNIITIMQHGLFCKGYNPTAATGYYGDGTYEAVKKIQSDAGYNESQITDVVSAKVLKEILSSDALVLVADGDEKIRVIQQSLNRDYGDLFDIIPCDGKYGAQTAEALIYALQREGGLSDSVANGNFGPATQEIASNHPQSNADYEASFVKIAKYALYCNGVRRNGVNVFDCSENGTFSGVFDSLMKEKVTAFQNFTGMLEVTGKIELKEWMSLLVSTGYPMRNVLACDTSTQLTDTKAKRLVSNDFEIVGRYLTGRTTSGPKYLTRDELNMLFDNNLSVFAIYQDETEYYQTHPEEETTENYYNYGQGYHDAEKACEAAENLGIEYGEYIFFSVDFDFTDDQTTSMILPHFQGISNYVRQHGNKYNVGVYGPRNICQRVLNNGYADLCFVSDMSTGYSGNKGYALPEYWAFDQIREYSQGAADGGFNVDCVAISGRYKGFNTILPEESNQTPVDSNEIALKYYRDIMQVLGLNYDELQFSKTYIYDLLMAKIEVTAEVGSEISIGSGNDSITWTVENGEYKEMEFAAAIDIIDEAAYSASVGFNENGVLDVINKIRFNIDNGYASAGINVSSDGTVSILYLIHKNKAVGEGLEEFMEIRLEITLKDKLTSEQLEDYNTYMNVLKAATSTVEIDFVGVVKHVFASLASALNSAITSGEIFYAIFFAVLIAAAAAVALA